MTFVTVVRLVVLAAITGVGGNFAWGIADHRGIEAVTNFADQHIVFPKPDREPALVFACDSSHPLVLYKLLSDEVKTKREEIEAMISSPLNLAFQNNLFSHYTAFGAGLFGTMFSLTDELRRWKARESTKLTVALIGAVVIPTSYVGYLASGWFRLECGSKTIYERLQDKRLWRLRRIDAAKIMFDKLVSCIDRRVTLPAEQASSASSAPDAGGTESPQDKNGRARASAQERQKAIDDWRTYIAAANTDLPQQSVVESRYREEAALPGREKPKTQPAWGDSFYQRIYGDEEGFVATDADFDKADFQLIFALDHRCGQLDTETAKTLYAKVKESSEPAATSVAKKDQEDFSGGEPRCCARSSRACSDRANRVTPLASP